MAKKQGVVNLGECFKKSRAKKSEVKKVRRPRGVKLLGESKELKAMVKKMMATTLTTELNRIQKTHYRVSDFLIKSDTRPMKSAEVRNYFSNKKALEVFYA